MKTLIISPNSPKISIGGVERYIKNFIGFCKAKNQKAIFLLPSNGKESCEKIGDVCIYRKKFLSVSYRRNFFGEETVKTEIEEKSKNFFLFLLKLFDKEKIGLVSAQNFYLGLPPVFSLVLNMACFSKRTPLVLRAHSYPTTEIQKALINNLFWKKIICISKSVAGDCFSRGTNINKITTKYLGVDIEKFKPGLDKLWLRKYLKLPNSHKIILHASRIITGHREILKEKGITTLIEAFSYLGLRYSDLRLLIAIASPPKRLHEEFERTLEKLRGYIRLHNLEGKVFYKKFSLDEMPLVFNGSDVFVLASENETLGQVYIEAMACGTPVIGTKTGGVTEIITDNYNGFLVRPNDPSTLGQKIEEMLFNEKLRKRIISSAVKVARDKFSTERQFNILVNYFRKLSVNF